MKIEYHKWYSPRLGRDMELKIYGHAGKALIHFPSQGGRFYEAEDYGLINSIAHFIENGSIRMITVDSVDHEAWSNVHAHPRDRGFRHTQFEQYLLHEVVPLVRNGSNPDEANIASTGCSMGAYHAANFFFKHPGVFDSVIAISGLYKLNMLVGDYADDNVYFNSPLMFLKNLEDEAILDRYRKSNIVIAVGQGRWEEDMIRDTLELKSVLEQKQIPAWIDLWGHDVDHDWPWWRQMMPYFIGKTVGGG
jgi:esterase/lipase superfamily enzyme